MICNKINKRSYLELELAPKCLEKVRLLRKTWHRGATELTSCLSQFFKKLKH